MPERKAAIEEEMMTNGEVFSFFAVLKSCGLTI
jgi:hypothetical protein